MHYLNLSKHIVFLRKVYVNSHPSGRIQIANQRIRYPNCGPNKIIVRVSAAEGIARSIIINLKQAKGENIKTVYKKYKHKNPDDIIRDICKEFRTGPWKFFGKKNWLDFIWAIKYRNLLIHECTFVRQTISNRLIKATDHIIICLKNKIINNKL